MVADRRLRATRRLDEVARAHLVVAEEAMKRQQAQPDRVGQRGERSARSSAWASSRASARTGRAAASGSSGDGLPSAMPNYIDRSSKKSIDMRRSSRHTHHRRPSMSIGLHWRNQPCLVSNSHSTSAISTPRSTSTRSCSSTPPAKIREGYANFAIAEPPLKLVLIAGARRPRLAQPHRRRGRVDRRGRSPPTARMQAEGCEMRRAGATSCCFAVQDKVWVTGPEIPWEIYTVLADAA